MDTNDYSKLSDEEFMKIIENIDDIEENEPEDDVYDGNEDTDQHDDSEFDNSDESETIEDNDDFFEDTDDEEKEDEDEYDGENSQEDEESRDEDDPDEPGSKDKSNADDGKTDEEILDYKKAYAEAIKEANQYKQFYNDVTSEFVANGKIMKGFSDPKKIIQAQQMAAGFSDKMQAFKKYRPFINPLKEKGIIDDPDKFNLMMNAIDGDKEAIKSLIKQANIDPMELDMENINYQARNNLASSVEIAFDDVVETATAYGVEDRVKEVITKNWDDQSVLELLEDPQNSADLVNHLSNGVYDMVQARIAEKKMTDPYGAYGKKKAIDQYREAANELEQEYLYALRLQQEQQPYDEQYVQKYQESSNTYQFSEEEIQAEMEKIRAEREYSSKVEKRNAQADKGRRKAASVSKRKPRTKKKETTFDPGQMSDEEFTEFLDNMILT